MGDRFRTGKLPRHRIRHPGRLSVSHLSVGQQKEYWLWKNGKPCVTVGPVTRTTSILTYSQLKALYVNRAGYPADICRMLA